MSKLTPIPSEATLSDSEFERVSNGDAEALTLHPGTSKTPLLPNAAAASTSGSVVSNQEPSSMAETSSEGSAEPTVVAEQGGSSASGMSGNEIDVAVSMGKRKDRDDEVEAGPRDAAVIKTGATNQVELPSSSKRPRLGQDPETAQEDEAIARTNSDVNPIPIAFSVTQNPVEPEVWNLDTSGQARTSSHQDKAATSTGKRKDRSEDAIPPEEIPSTSQTPAATPSNQISATTSLTENEGKAPLVKKQRLDANDPALDITPAITAPEAGIFDPKPSPLLTLPLELIAEILILTGSPQYVLATARSCKALCQTLLSSDAEFIWREARKGSGCRFEHTKYPGAFLSGQTEPQTEFVELPDPPKQFFGEAAYAVFLFDAGPCDNCQNETSTMYHSFGLRLRLCKRRACTWSSKFTTINTNDVFEQRISAVLPTNEAPPTVLSHKDLSGPFWPNMPISFHLTEDKDNEIMRYRPVSEDFSQKKFALRAKRKIEWMEFCVKLLKWKKVRESHYTDNVKDNESMTRKIASKYGWEYEELLNTVYGPYLRNKNRLIEKVNEVDVKVTKDEIESRLLTLSEKRGRRNTEVALMNNRKDVEKTYNSLRSNKAYPYFPSLQTFRTLPVVSMLQSAESPSPAGTIYDTLLKDKAMKDLLASQLKKWTDTAKSDLGAILGFPKNWKNASKNILHPVERVTARFLCTKCHRVDVKYRGDECLDFAGACLHECAVGNQKKAARLRKGKKAVWDSKIFVKDEKAVKVLKNAIEALGYAEDRDGGNQLLKVGYALVCTSCDPGMVLDSRSIIGHSHRHDDMQMTFTTPLEDLVSYMGGYPHEHGLVQRLLGPLSLTIAGKAEIDRKNYSCRHCLREKQVAEAATAAAMTDAEGTTDAGAQGSEGANAAVVPLAAGSSASKDQIQTSSLVYRMHKVGVSGPAVRPPPLFNFNGMRSHMKGKHGIEDIRDEDILCYQPPQI